MLTVWHHDSRSRTLETVSPYQHNTVLKLCHVLSCIHRNSWSAFQFQRNQLNSVFESCFTFVVRLFHCLAAHKLVKFITTQMFFHFHVANIMAPGLMSYLCSPAPSSLAPSELQCGLYALWLVTFSVSWSVYMSVQKKKTKMKLIYQFLKVQCNRSCRYFILFVFQYHKQSF